MLKRLSTRFHPSPERVILRARWLGEARSRELIARVLALPTEALEHWYQRTLQHYQDRHRDLKKYLSKHSQWAMTKLGQDASPLSEAQKHLIGAYFTMEYSIEAAAFFNPSVVLAPDQSGLEAEQSRLLFSFRSVGEGHISSVVFQEAILEGEQLSFETPSRYVELPEVQPLSFDKQAELHPQLSAEHVESIVNSISLPANQHQHVLDVHEQAYALSFRADAPLSERVLFPELPVESNGIEDARFVCFSEDDGSQSYYGTYTAYNGREIQPRLLKTHDFLVFQSLPLFGAGAQNKNLALFPRRINGRYAMLSRLDGVNNYISFSEQMTHWENPQLLNTPLYPWEFGNTGNCGSPLETEAGWLVITHGVGPMREYAISAMLLDLADPSQVIARLKEPLLIPNADEREGYVPNVVYSCGSLIAQGQVLIPYGASDRFATLATIPLAELLAQMESA